MKLIKKAEVKPSVLGVVFDVRPAVGVDKGKLEIMLHNPDLPSIKVMTRILFMKLYLLCTSRKCILDDHIEYVVIDGRTSLNVIRQRNPNMDVDIEIWEPDSVLEAQCFAMAWNVRTETGNMRDFQKCLDSLVSRFGYSVEDVLGGFREALVHIKAHLISRDDFLKRFERLLYQAKRNAVSNAVNSLRGPVTAEEKRSILSFVHPKYHTEINKKAGVQRKVKKPYFCASGMTSSMVRKAKELLVSRPDWTTQYLKLADCMHQAANQLRDDAARGNG